MGTESCRYVWAMFSDLHAGSRRWLWKEERASPMGGREEGMGELIWSRGFKMGNFDGRAALEGPPKVDKAMGFGRSGRVGVWRAIVFGIGGIDAGGGRQGMGGSWVLIAFSWL